MQTHPPKTNHDATVAYLKALPLVVATAESCTAG
jgi:nicotinamide mononucleotide (NMN) deamidase PncC